MVYMTLFDTPYVIWAISLYFSSNWSVYQDQPWEGEGHLPNKKWKWQNVLYLKETQPIALVLRGY